MAFFQLIPLYLFWHYTRAWLDIARLYSNFAWFLYHFFSIRILLGTLFSPWKRLHEGRREAEAGILGAFLINSIARVVGALIRFVTVSAGVISLIFLTAAFVFVLLLWLFMPLAVLFLFAGGIAEIFNLNP